MKFLVWCTDYGQKEDGAEEIEAGDAEEAAEIAAEKDYNSDPSGWGSPLTFTIRAVGDPMVVTVRVHADYDVTFSADMAKEVA